MPVMSASLKCRNKRSTGSMARMPQTNARLRSAFLI
jgi:hypothetical protein